MIRVATLVVAVLMTYWSDAVRAEYRQVDVCFAVDTTGSMGGLLQIAKDKIWFIANALAAAPGKPDVRYCLMAYRDQGEAYVTQHTDLTTDMDLIYEKLSALNADGGGDEPEAVNQALLETVMTTTWAWQADVFRVIFLIGDAPPRSDDGLDYRQIATTADGKGILINPILVGENQRARDVWRQIAETANGTSAQISQTEHRAIPSTPMDQDLVALNQRLGTLLLPYGSDAQQQQLKEKQRRAEALADAAVADRLRYNLTAGVTVHGSGDLLEDIDSGRVSLASVDRSGLPTTLRSMSASELNVHLQQLREQRRSIQAVVGRLLAQRQQHIDALWEADDHSFEATVAKMIHHQLGSGAGH